MARIRIVEAWLRCPTAPPTHRRAVMVVAEAWAEQRVLMRAYADSPDQTRPTIALHGAQLAIGPAGADPHGPWGIHVEPPADGRAQALRTELEVAAQRLFGSKGNPPRLADEESGFDRKRTSHWAPGTPQDLPHPPGRAASGYYEPSEAASPWPPAGPPASGPPAWAALQRPQAPTVELGPGQPGASPPAAPAPAPAHGAPATSTVHGFAPGVGARLAEDRSAPASEVSRRPPAPLLGRTLPLGLRLTDQEHQVLDALGEARTLTAAQVGRIAGTADGAGWMQAFIVKLTGCGLDLIAPTTDAGGEPMYVLRG